jgi:hypothetical protein
MIDMFKNIKDLMKIHIINKIKIIKCDKGGKYNFENFNVFCDKNNIVKQSIIEYILKQHGIGKRIN